MTEERRFLDAFQAGRVAGGGLRPPRPPAGGLALPARQRRPPRRITALHGRPPALRGRPGQARGLPRDDHLGVPAAGPAAAGPGPAGRELGRVHGAQPGPAGLAALGAGRVLPGRRRCPRSWPAGASSCPTALSPYSRSRTNSSNVVTPSCTRSRQRSRSVSCPPHGHATRSRRRPGRSGPRRAPRRRRQHLEDARAGRGSRPCCRSGSPCRGRTAASAASSAPRCRGARGSAARAAPRGCRQIRQIWRTSRWQVTAASAAREASAAARPARAATVTAWAALCAGMHGDHQHAGRRAARRAAPWPRSGIADSTTTSGRTAITERSVSSIRGPGRRSDLDLPHALDRPLHRASPARPRRAGLRTRKLMIE